MDFPLIHVHWQSTGPFHHGSKLWETFTYCTDTLKQTSYPPYQWCALCCVLVTVTMWVGSAGATQDTKGGSASCSDTSARCRTVEGVASVRTVTATVPRASPGTSARRVSFVCVRVEVVRGCKPFSLFS